MGVIRVELHLLHLIFLGLVGTKSYEYNTSGAWTLGWIIMILYGV